MVPVSGSPLHGSHLGPESVCLLLGLPALVLLLLQVLHLLLHSKHTHAHLSLGGSQAPTAKVILRTLLWNCPLFQMPITVCPQPCRRKAPGPHSGLCFFCSDALHQLLLHLPACFLPRCILPQAHPTT